MTTNHMQDTLLHHACGGTILHGGSGEQAHSYCDRCGAFAYDSAECDVPDGTDPIANHAAWDEGEECSPEPDALREDLIAALSRYDDGTGTLGIVVDQAIRDGVTGVAAIAAILDEAIEDARIEREREGGILSKPRETRS
jgi:hypothetical protein